MAKSNSFNKREVEKRKQEKRKEKQQKKEDRKGSGSSSFEDMIAYVDENGVITETPPEVRKVSVDLDDIEISTPKKTESDEVLEQTGRIEYYDESKGYGFIKDKMTVNKYFFHKSNAEESVKENNIVTFRLERGVKGMNAVDVKIVK